MRLDFRRDVRNSMDESSPDAISEELDSLGRGTGVEAETLTESPDAIIEPFDPERIDVITRNPTVDLLLSRIRGGRIDLQPDFQRHTGIWTEGAKSRLIESLLLRIPLPTLYAAESGDEVWSIVDGIQRLTTIAQFIAPGLIAAKPLKLKGLEYLGSQYNGAGYDDLPGRLQTRLRETELVVHLIRQGTPEEVKFNIFARLNTGGLPLTTQELRHALIPGPARTILREWAESPEFIAATKGSVRSDRMADREMVLRFIAFRRIEWQKYSSQDFDAFLREAMRAMNDMSQEQLAELAADFLSSMRRSRDLFGANAFRKQYNNGRRYPINKALFEAVSVNVAELGAGQMAKLMDRREEVNARFASLIAGDYYFDRAISQGTGDIGKILLRFRRVNEILTEESS